MKARRFICEDSSIVSDDKRTTLMANQLGKMYICNTCGAQVIVTKGGDGTLKCCGTEMRQK